jgi:hypothetical protein
MKKFTHAEHRARAMLMGKVYDWRDGCYSDPMIFSGVEMSSTRGMLDAVTLEPMEQEDADDRIATEPGWPGYAKHNQDDPPLPTPYADE